MTSPFCTLISLTFVQAANAYPNLREYLVPMTRNSNIFSFLCVLCASAVKSVFIS
jgi:hypothetical protein